MEPTPANKQGNLRWLSIALIALGVLGFIPGITQNYFLFGLFQVGPWFNLIYIALGGIGLAMIATRRSASGYAKTLAAVFAVWAVIGLFVGDTVGNTGQVLGFINNNYWSVLLNAVMAVIAASIGWSAPSVETNRRESLAFGEYERNRRKRR